MAQSRRQRTRAIRRRPTAERGVVLTNAYGLHLRPAKGFVELAQQYEELEVAVRKDGAAEVADGRSILSLLVLQAEKGSRLLIRCQGLDAEAACAVLTEYLETLPYLPGEAPPGEAPPAEPPPAAAPPREQYPEAPFPSAAADGEARAAER